MVDAHDLTGDDARKEQRGTFAFRSVFQVWISLHKLVLRVDAVAQHACLSCFRWGTRLARGIRFAEQLQIRDVGNDAQRESRAEAEVKCKASYARDEAGRGTSADLGPAIPRPHEQIGQQTDAQLQRNPGGQESISS